MRSNHCLFTNGLSTLAVKLIAVVGIVMLLVACGGSTGGSTSSSTPRSTGNSPSSNTTETITYTGPQARDAAVQDFYLTVWSELALPSRCGACHVQNGAATPAFVRTDDINAAYDVAISLIDTANPAQSRLATKVTEPHNCWLANPTVCGNLITSYVQNMTSSGDTTSFLGALNLSDPALRPVGDSKQFPALADQGTNEDFESTIYQLTSQYCGTCHSESSSLQQQPYIGSDDPQVAYEAARTRINLADESADTLADAVSRLVVRLRDESHNCWGGNCTTSANSMLTAIQTFAGSIPITTVDPNLVTSMALDLADGLSASSGGGRVETNVIAKWDFGAGSGTFASDISGVDPALDLNFSGNIEWMASGGVRINDGKLQGTTTASAKIYDRITTTGEYSIEAWVVPLNVTQDGPARIVTYAGDVDSRNFMLGQNTYDYDFRVRSSVTDGDGLPALSTPMADEVAQATLQHVVATYNATDGRRIYVNGELVTGADASGAGNFSSWNRNYAFAVGDEVSNDNQWQGSVRLLAIHNRALAPEDIQTNYDIGVGQKYYLLFSISSYTSVPRSYVVFQVEQFDDYGYLFNQPFFVSLEPGASIPDITIEGMRVGINGQEAAVGQAFSNLDVTVTQAAVTAEEGIQRLSQVGTIIGVDQGPDTDEFFLTFESLGPVGSETTNVFVEATPTAQNPTPSTDEQADIGIKTFDEINEALSALTGISKTNTNVVTTFDSVEQQLPVNPSIDGFSSAQQMAVTQLAVKYCDELINQEAALDAGGNDPGGYFPNFDFGESPATAFDTQGRSDIISPLMDSLLANTVSSADQPSFAVAEAELDSLMTILLTNCSSDSCSQNNDRVGDVVIASCAAAFASSMMLIQ